MRRRLALLLVLCASPAAHAAPPDDALVADSVALAGSVLINGRAFDYLRELTDRHGPRLTGSPVLEGAVTWCMAQLRAAGVADVRREDYPLPARWERGGATARMTAPLVRELHVAPIPWSPPTPPAGLRAQVMVLRSLDAKALAAPELRGKLVIIDTGSLLARMRPSELFGRLDEIIDQLARAKIAGFIWTGRKPNQLLTAGGIFADARAGLFPGAVLGLEDWKLIERTMRDGPVEIELHIEGKLLGAGIAANVVGEIRGRELPDEVVIVGAHLDAWDLATGAQDNGSGVAEVLEAARAIAAHGRPPRRTVRFALWTGEEQGSLGARAYTRGHKAELDRIVAVLNTDNGAGAPRGWETEGRQDVRDALEPLARRLLPGLGAEVRTTFACDTDHAVFAVWGVPALNMIVDDSSYDLIHHLPADTLDKVVPESLAAAAASLTVTVWALAEQSGRLGPRLSLKDVDALLKSEDAASCAQLRK